MSAHSTRAADLPPRELPDVDSLRGRQRERRERLIEAATRLMVQADYPTIQIKDVADAADVALGTLYRYFNSKDHLFACALLNWSAGFGGRIERSSDATTLKKVQAVFRRAARAFEREPRVFDVLMLLQSSRDEHAAEVFQEFSRRQQAAFGLALADLPAVERDDVVAVMGAVLSEALRGRQLGLLTGAQVYRRIDRAAELILR